jgi:hypothetical protein
MICPDSMTWDVYKGFLFTGMMVPKLTKHMSLKWIYRTSKIKVFGEFGWIWVILFQIYRSKIQVFGDSQRTRPLHSGGKSWLPIIQDRTVLGSGEWQFGYFFKRCSCTDKTILCAFWRQVSVFLGNITTWLGNVLNVSLLNWSIVFPMWIVPLDLYFWDGLQPPISLNQFEIPFWVVYIFTGSWFCSCGLTDHW